jgi:hypothetical protein
MRLGLFVIVALLLSSCATRERCARKFPPQVSDTTITTISYYDMDTTIYVPGDTVYLTKYIGCDSLKLDTVVRGKRGAVAKVKINEGVLTVTAGCDSLEAVVKLQGQIIKEHRDRVEVHVQEPEKRPWWHYWVLYPLAFIGLISIVYTVNRFFSS